jgi:hypothetical protein
MEFYRDQTDGWGPSGGIGLVVLIVIIILLLR